MESSNSLEYLKTLFENLKDVKYIKRNRRVYKFFINKGSLILNIYSDGHLIETKEIENNVKFDFDVCSDEEGDIHIVVVNKKYEIQYIKFNGVNWNKERIYYLNNAVGIPSSPKIRVYDNVVYIVLSFEQPNSENEWSLRSYIKINSEWSTRVIDRGREIFYCHYDFFVDNCNVHLIYRNSEKHNTLKYCFFDLAQGWWERPKIAVDSDNNKYKPNIFISNENIICVWIEINGEQLYLCSTINFSKNYFRIEVQKNIKNVLLFYRSGHIYGIIDGECELCNDLCCKKNAKVDWRFLIENKEDMKMAEDVRFFLNIKKEMEFENTKLKERINELEETLVPPELSQENDSLKQEILQRENTIGELREILSSTEQENSQLHEIVARLSQENEDLLAINEELRKSAKEDINIKNENNQFLKRIMGFMKKDA